MEKRENFRVKTGLVFQPPFGKIGAMENEPSEKNLKPNCLGKKYTSKFIKFSPKSRREARKLVSHTKIRDIKSLRC